MPLIETTRATLHHRDYRLPDVKRPPMLLVHGAGGTFRNWPIQIRKQTHTIAVDLAGHGKSPLPGRDSIADYAADLAVFLETIGVEQAIIAGHSMGGAIAQQMALTYPTLVAGLILAGTGASLPVNEAIINGIVNDPESTAQQLMQWSWAKNVPEAIKQQGVDILLQTPPTVIQGDYIACNAFDVRDQLHTISVPTLVIGGTADRMTRHTWSEFLAERIPNAQLVSIDGGGHMFLLEQPEHITNVMTNWLRAL